MYRIVRIFTVGKKKNIIVRRGTNKCINTQISLFRWPLLWCTGKASASDAVGRWFDPRSGHTKDFKNDSNVCPPWRSRLRGKHDDLLAGVRINGPVVPVTYQENVTIQLKKCWKLRKLPNNQTLTLPMFYSCENWFIIVKFSQLKLYFCTRLAIGTLPLVSRKAMAWELNNNKRRCEFLWTQ